MKKTLLKNHEGVVMRYYYDSAKHKGGITPLRDSGWVDEPEELKDIHESQIVMVDGEFAIDLERVREDRAEKRKRAYRNGDYIDAIMKQLNYDRLQGKELIQEMDDAIAHWLNVKQVHPLD